MAQDIVSITAETTAADIAKLAATWAYQSGGVPSWLITRLLFAERRIAELKQTVQNMGLDFSSRVESLERSRADFGVRIAELEKAAGPVHVRKQEKRG